MAELDARKRRILSAVVDSYTRTGEPVGSKLISEMLGGQFSSATIRNDMAVLFDMGLLEQPHTSAGRIPSHLGYRVYLNQLMPPEPLTTREKREIEALFNRRNPDPNRLLEDAAKALAGYTNYAVVSTTLAKQSAAVRRIEMIPASRRTAVILLMTTDGMVRSRVCRVDFNLTPKIIEFFQNFANGILAGKGLNDITASYLNSMAFSLGDEYGDIFAPVLTTIFELCRECSDGRVYRSGTSNLLEYEELRNVANLLFRAIASDSSLIELLNRSGEGTQVIVGKENPRSEFADSSIVFCKYRIGEDSTGAIGLIGPVRMDYARLLPHLEYFAQMLGQLLGDTLNDEDE